MVDQNCSVCFCAQVIGKGVPEDAMQGIPDKQVPLPDSLNNFQYMYNSTGSKVRERGALGCSSHQSSLWGFHVQCIRVGTQDTPLEGVVCLLSVS